MIPELDEASQPWYVRISRYGITHVGLAALVLALDFIAGPVILFPVFFIFPVVFAAWFSAPRYGYVLAILQPLVKFGFAFFSRDLQGTLSVSVINLIIRIMVLLFIAYLVSRTAQQTRELAREIKLLEGILPICSFCKKIRDEHNEWQQMEAYLAEHSKADFTHGVCPECAERHYGEVLRDNPTPRSD